uniref:Trypsinogen-like protein 3 n=1 Tax=Echeneis naucrates TaxID=173247 RepID=A0A665SVM2_ECHNA
MLLSFSPFVSGASPLNDNKVCQPHSRPWQVSLRGGGKSCSGALIDKWWLVTSYESYTTIASLGEHDVTATEGTEQHIQVADVIRHSPYRSPLHSLTMVRLARPAQLNKYVQPIPLPSRCPQPGELCHVSGWGSTIPNQYEPAQSLKCINVAVVNDGTCMDSLPDYVYWSTGMICAGQQNTDNCMDNAGSVMVCDGQLQGVQWFNSGCRNPADPTVYTKLCNYSDWIKNVMDRFAPVLPTETPPVRTTK